MTKDSRETISHRCMHSNSFKTAITIIVSITIAVGSIITSLEMRQDGQIGELDTKVFENSYRLGIVEYGSKGIKANTNDIRKNKDSLSDVKLDYVKATSKLSNSITELDMTIKLLKIRFEKEETLKDK